MEKNQIESRVGEFLDALENENASKWEKFWCGVVWALIMGALYYILLWFCYVFA